VITLTKDTKPDTQIQDQHRGASAHRLRSRTQFGVEQALFSDIPTVSASKQLRPTGAVQDGLQCTARYQNPGIDGKENIVPTPFIIENSTIQGRHTSSLKSAEPPDSLGQPFTSNNSNLDETVIKKLKEEAVYNSRTEFMIAYAKAVHGLYQQGNFANPH
jgi:hypothetical protein